MKQKWLYKAFVGLFLALCLTLSVGMAVAGPSQAGANENLSDLPQLKDKDGKWNLEYLSQLQDWVNDRFFLRQELISLDRLLTGKLFGTSGENGVILGTDGWLYYADTLADYTGVEGLTERELYSAAKNLALMAEFCRENGRDFLFVIAPNKNSLYDANMPDFGVKTEQSDAQKLMALLESMNVDTVDLFAAFEKEEEILYFAHDSHWNSKGAALGADLINGAFGVESDYYGSDFSGRTPHQGDLYDMMYPALTDPEQDPVFGGKLEFTFAGKSTRPDAIVLNTESKAAGSLLAYRDSFGNLLFPFLADSYGTARFSRSTAYDLTVEADHVLVELVERNISYLITYLPIMEAPQRDVEIPAESAGTIGVTAGKRGDFVQVKGELPAIDDGSAIYVVCGDTVYEAFCMAQSSFGVNLPADEAAQAVICTVNGQLTRYDIEK